ncbi:unnamed protein product, partial [Notodromas monacha]
MLLRAVAALGSSAPGKKNGDEPDVLLSAGYYRQPSKYILAQIMDYRPTPYSLRSSLRSVAKDRQFLLESSRYDEAAAEYETAAELAPDDVDAVLNAANALRQAGINSKAEKFYRRAVLLQPNVSLSK